MRALQGFDQTFILFINSFSGRYPLLDKCLIKLDQLSLIKAGLFVAFLVYVWFRRERDWDHDREFVIRTMIGVVLAIAVSRMLQDVLPSRARPMFDLDLNLRLPAQFHTNLVLQDSSFPSDTTALATALATAVYIENRVLGYIAALIVLFSSISTKLYLGYHYPTDIAGGIAIGVLLMSLAHAVPIPHWVVAATRHLHDTHRGLFYAAMFVGLWQIATLFSDTRLIGRGMLEIVGAALTRF